MKFAAISGTIQFMTGTGGSDTEFLVLNVGAFPAMKNALTRSCLPERERGSEMKDWLWKVFCRHDWAKKREPVVLEETGEICGVIVEMTCKKCGKKTVGIAVM